FLAVTPWSCTWEGSRGKAWVTRFSTSTWAMFRSVPISKVTVRLYWPSLLDCDDMYNMFSTPLTCCSIGAATVSATTCAFPGPDLDRIDGRRPPGVVRVVGDITPEGQADRDRRGFSHARPSRGRARATAQADPGPHQQPRPGQGGE